MAVKLLCLDIDGTILDGNKRLTAETKRAVALAKKRGVRVFLASGRSYPGLRELMEELDLEGNCICMNGTLIYADGKEIYRHGLEPSMTEKILDCIEKYDSQLFLSGDDFNLTNKPVEGQISQVVQQGSLRGDYIICTDPQEFRKEAERLGPRILKAAVKELDEENFPRMRADLEALGLFHIAKSDTYFVDISPLGCTKGRGVEETARYLGIPMSEVMCIGDNENDAEMVEKAGIGVAMGNAEECVKRSADYITETNDEDGAAKAILRFCGERSYLVTDHGVIPDLQELQTEAVQDVIERCRESGGGEIIFPAGRYQIGSIRLYSDMTVRLLRGACLCGSRDHRDYRDFHVPSTLGYLTDEHYIKLWNLPEYYIYGMICAFGEKNISIIGEADSRIDGQDCRDDNGEEHFRGPMGMIFSGCEDIHLEGYTFVNSANWSHQIDSCRNVSVRNVTILAGHDGLNLHHCTGVRVDHCRFETGDDCFAGYDVEDLKVRDCYINTACNAMRLGGYDILFERCVFEGPGHYPHISEGTYETHAVFKYYAMRPDTIRRDGGKIVIRDSSISDVRTLFSYHYGKEELMQNNRPLRDITLENVRISGVKKRSCFKGNGEECRLILKNVSLTVFKEDAGREDGLTQRTAENRMRALFDTDEAVELLMENVSAEEQKTE